MRVYFRSLLNLYLFFVCFFAVCYLVGVDHFVLSASDDIYENGFALNEAGDWHAALELWSTALDSTGETQIVDPRIGFDFIELATQHRASEFYETANSLYLQGLVNPNIETYVRQLEREFNRILPLLEPEKQESWRSEFAVDKKKIGEKIRLFWNRKDPIPTTAINERLLEHWERIAYVRKHYNRDSTTVYNTDDRGLVFVKYGSPEKSFEGKLGVDQFEIIRWFDDFLLRQEIQRYNSLPEFEIWLYQYLQEDEATIFLFGKKEGFGRYGLRNGLEDFIPGRAFRRGSTRTTQGVLPGLMLQLMFYNELQGVDKFYLERYRQLEAMWVNARASGRLSPNKDVGLGLLNHYRAIDQDNAGFKFTVPDQTHTLEALEKLYVKFKSFRYLDSDRKSRLNIVVASGNAIPGQNSDESFFTPSQKTRFKQRHILITYHNNSNRIDRLVHYPDVQNSNTSVFDITHPDSAEVLRLVAEKVLLDARRTELQEADLPDTARVIGIGSGYIANIKPLSGSTDQFETSDLIVGTAAGPKTVVPDDYTFPLIPVDPLRPDSIAVYFELYHLKLGKKKTAKYKIECVLSAISKKGTEEKKKERKKVKFEFNGQDTDVKKIIRIDASGLKAGYYELQLKVSDKNAKKTKLRTARFKLVDR